MNDPGQDYKWTGGHGLTAISLPPADLYLPAFFGQLTVLSQQGK